jgi:DNA-binding transcriptional LysR family regulator
MDVRQMRYFLRIAEELNFHRAAESLHLSQPSLSQQIRSLEEEIGAALFHRTNRKVQLTQAGESLLPRVRGILHSMDEAISEAQRVNQGISGLLTLAFGSTALVGILPAALREFQKQAPNVDLQLKECEPKEQIASIIQRTCDVGFVHAKLDEDQLDSMVIQRDELIAAIPCDISEEGPIDLSRYNQYAAIMPSPFTTFGFYGHVQRAYQLAGAQPSKHLYTNLIIGGIHLVAAGMGIALVPSSFRSIQIPGVAYKTLRKNPPAVELIAVWRRDSTLKLLYRFLDILKALSRCQPAVPASAG